MTICRIGKEELHQLLRGRVCKIGSEPQFTLEPSIQLRVDLVHECDVQRAHYELEITPRPHHWNNASGHEIEGAGRLHIGHRIIMTDGAFKARRKTGTHRQKVLWCGCIPALVRSTAISLDGRAVRLTMMNVMQTRPGLLDRAVLGNPGKYSFCFAENEEDHPWEPFHVSRGLSSAQSAVTVYASNSLYQVYNQLAAEPEPLLLCWADALSNLGLPNIKGFNQALLVAAGEHTEILRQSGWSRRQVQSFLIEHARRRVADLKRAARLPGEATAADETTWRYFFEKPDDILIVCE